MRLPASGGDPLKAKARVVNIAVQANPVRVAYAFQGLADEGRDRLERVVFDTVLDQMAR